MYSIEYTLSEVKSETLCCRKEWVGNRLFLRVFYAGGDAITVWCPTQIQLISAQGGHEGGAEQEVDDFRRGVTFLNGEIADALIVSNDFQQAFFGSPLRVILDFIAQYSDFVIIAVFLVCLNQIAETWRALQKIDAGKSFLVIDTLDFLRGPTFLGNALCWALGIYAAALGRWIVENASHLAFHCIYLDDVRVGRFYFITNIIPNRFSGADGVKGGEGNGIRFHKSEV